MRIGIQTHVNRMRLHSAADDLPSLVKQQVLEVTQDPETDDVLPASAVFVEGMQEGEYQVTIDVRRPTVLSLIAEELVDRMVQYTRNSRNMSSRGPKHVRMTSAAIVSSVYGNFDRRDLVVARTSLWHWAEMVNEVFIARQRLTRHLHKSSHRCQRSVLRCWFHAVIMCRKSCRLSERITRRRQAAVCSLWLSAALKLRAERIAASETAHEAGAALIENYTAQRAMFRRFVQGNIRCSFFFWSMLIRRSRAMQALCSTVVSRRQRLLTASSLLAWAMHVSEIRDQRWKLWQLASKASTQALSLNP